MKYFILKHTDPTRIQKQESHPPWICRVFTTDREATILNETFHDFVSSGCYGSYKALVMTKKDFDKGTLTPVYTLTELPDFIMNKMGYYPY